MYLHSIIETVITGPSHPIYKEKTEHNGHPASVLEDTFYGEASKYATPVRNLHGEYESMTWHEGFGDSTRARLA